MDGLMTSEAPETTPVVRAQHYDTAMRKVRLSMPTKEWRDVCARETRHYKTGMGLRQHNGIYGGAPLIAWLHAMDASPWLLPQPETEAAIVAGYVEDDAVLRGVSPLTPGAEALSDLKELRVIRLSSIGEIRAWLQRIGPCVLGGVWGRQMDDVRRDTEVVGDRSGETYPHAVALVGIRPGFVRLVNDRGAEWGALGRAWLPDAMMGEILLDGGEAWGVVPVDLTPKRGAK